MAISRALRRLLSVRQLEEQQSRLELESAVAELQERQAALMHNAERNSTGRRIFSTGVRNDMLTDRLAGIEEQRASARHAVRLRERVNEADQRVQILRDSYLATRIERQQAQTLIEEMAERDAQEALRRAQQDMDDWYRGRSLRQPE